MPYPTSRRRIRKIHCLYGDAQRASCFQPRCSRAGPSRSPKVGPAHYGSQSVNDKDRYECGPCQYVAFNDVEAEIRQKHEPEPFPNVELIVNLWIHLYMVVVRHMSSREKWNPMLGKVKEEEESVVDEERSNKL